MRYDARTAVTAHSGTWSLTLPALSPEQQAWLVQTVPGNQVHRLRGQEVTLRFWTRSAEAAQAQITIDDGRDETAQDVRLTPRWQPYELHHRVAADADRLRVLIAPVAAGEGSSAGFFDDLSLRCADGELLRNGSVEAPKHRWEGWTAGYLRLPLWFSRGLFDPTSYDAASLKRYGFYLAVTFGNFWGDYGWLTLPLPMWAYVLLALATLGAAVGWCWAGQLLPGADLAGPSGGLGRRCGPFAHDRAGLAATGEVPFPGTGALGCDFRAGLARLGLAPGLAALVARARAGHSAVGHRIAVRRRRSALLLLNPVCP
jgi:hypothetical protein